MTSNDQRSWDTRFTKGQWDEVQGEQLTQTFAECILKHLPGRVVKAIGEGRTLDWGCARGELVLMWRALFPDAEIDGLDFSLPAIKVAQSRASELDLTNGKFIWHGHGTIEEPYDVVVTSNVMEHLVEPLVKVREHLPMVGRFYVILTPFMEDLGGADREAMTPTERDAAGHTHVQKFTAESFPTEIGRFRRTFADTEVVPGPIWPGRQMLVVYERIVQN
jgi:predicted TPR repeat methyltransferase